MLQRELLYLKFPSFPSLFACDGMELINKKEVAYDMR